MIITQVIGGLGNQMFQYATARALAIRLNTDLLLDIAAYDAKKMHQGFELQRIFNIHAGIANSEDVRRVLGWQAFPGVGRLLRHRIFSRFRSGTWFAEPHYFYWDGLSHATEECYLSGYWQSERYFADAAAILRAEFAFTLPASEQNARLAQQIEAANSISLHVRRGDYVSNNKSHAVHGSCSPEYYRRAVQYMAQQVADPHFYIFSDDMEWVRQELRLPFPCKYVENNRGSESYNDMRLMSLCKHHIIANSTFSWWGAWLNSSPQKIVIAPERWFVDDRNTADLYPKGWIRL